MTLRSVDLQVMLPKVQEVGRVQQIQNQQEQVQQQQFAVELQRKNEKEQHQVQQTPQSGQANIDRDKKGKHALAGDDGEKETAQDGQKENDSGGEEAKDPKKGKLIDIKI